MAPSYLPGPRDSSRSPDVQGSGQLRGAKAKVRTSRQLCTGCPQRPKTSSGARRPVNIQATVRKCPPAPTRRQGDGARIPAPKPHFPSPALPPRVPQRPAKDRLGMAYHRLWPHRPFRPAGRKQDRAVGTSVSACCILWAAESASRCGNFLGGLAAGWTCQGLSLQANWGGPCLCKG